MVIPPEVHAVGIAYRTGKNRGYVVTRFTVSGQRVLSEELVSPEPEAINFATARLRGAAADIVQSVREDAEVALGKPARKA